MQNLDIFGIEPVLHFRGKEKFTHIRGALLGILLFAIGIGLFVFFANDMIHRTNPRTNRSDLKLGASMELFDLTPDIFNMKFGLSISGAQTYLVDEKYFVARAETYVPRNLIKDGCYNIFELTLDLCPSTAGDGLMYCFHPKIPEKMRNCLKDPSQENLFLMQNQDATKIYIDFFKCMGSKCKSDEEIFNMLNTGYFVAEYEDWGIDPQDYEEPLKPFIAVDAFAIIPDMWKIAVYDIGKITFTTDYGIAVSETKTIEAVSKKYFYTDVSPPSNEKFFRVALRNLGSSATFTRQYDKIQDVLAQFNGVIGICIFVLGALYLPYSKFKLYEKVANDVFTVSLNDKANLKSGATTAYAQPSTKTQKSARRELTKLLNPKMKKRLANVNTTKKDKYAISPPTDPPEKTLMSENNELMSARSEAGKMLIHLNSGNTLEPKILMTPIDIKSSPRLSFEDNEKVSKEPPNANATNVSLPDDVKRSTIPNFTKKQTIKTLEVDDTGVLLCVSPEKKTSQFSQIRKLRSSQSEMPKSIEGEPEYKDPDFSGFSDLVSPTSITPVQPADHLAPFVLESDTARKRDIPGRKESEADWGIGEQKLEINSQGNEEKRGETMNFRSQSNEEENNIPKEEIISEKTNVNWFQFLIASVRRNPRVELIRKGMDEISNTIDIYGIMNVTRDVENLKKCLLTPEQRVIFNNLKKPLLSMRSTSVLQYNRRRQRAKHKQGFDEEELRKQIFECYQVLKKTAEEDEMSKRILELYEEFEE